LSPLCIDEAKITSLVGFTFKVLIPHDEHSPIKQDRLYYSSLVGLGQIIKLHGLIRPENVI